MNVSNDELKLACGARLSRYKIPKEFRMVVICRETGWARSTADELRESTKV